MNTQEQKPKPEVGMPVTWINPDDDPMNKAFIQRHHIEAYGREEIQVLTLKNVGDNWQVTLNRNGNPIPCLILKGKPLEFDWGYLRPLSKKEIETGRIEK